MYVDFYSIKTNKQKKAHHKIELKINRRAKKMREKKVEGEEEKPNQP